METVAFVMKTAMLSWNATVCVAIITSIIAKSAIPKTHPATKNGAKRELRQTIVNPTKKLRLVRMI